MTVSKLENVSGLSILAICFIFQCTYIRSSLLIESTDSMIQWRIHGGGGQGGCSPPPHSTLPYTYKLMENTNFRLEVH